MRLCNLGFMTWESASVDKENRYVNNMNCFFGICLCIHSIFVIVSLITWKSGAQKMGCQKQNLQRIARANCQTMHLG